MPIEVEARFRAESAWPLDQLAVRPTLGGADLGEPRTIDEVDRYLDTGEGHLAAARWACRLRWREGTTRISLKGPPTATKADWHHRRPEVEGPASATVDPEAWPSSPARELLDRLREGRPLHERLRLDQARTERAVSLRDGTPIGTLSLDRARIFHRGADLGEILVVELELRAASSGAERELKGLAAALGSIEGLVAEPRSKLACALERISAGR